MIIVPSKAESYLEIIKIPSLRKILVYAAQVLVLCVQALYPDAVLGAGNTETVSEKEVVEIKSKIINTLKERDDFPGIRAH